MRRAAECSGLRYNGGMRWPPGAPPAARGSTTWRNAVDPSDVSSAGTRSGPTSQRRGMASRRPTPPVPTRAWATSACGMGSLAPSAMTAWLPVTTARFRRVVRGPPGQAGLAAPCSGSCCWPRHPWRGGFAADAAVRFVQAGRAAAGLRSPPWPAARRMAPAARSASVQARPCRWPRASTRAG